MKHDIFWGNFLDFFLYYSIMQHHVRSEYLFDDFINLHMGIF
jgi:hypothetical protein